MRKDYSVHVILTKANQLGLIKLYLDESVRKYIWHALQFSAAVLIVVQSIELKWQSAFIVEHGVF